MSGIPQIRELWITPLSPVHMGTDEDYTPTNYVIDGDALFEFDHRALARLPEAERRRLDSILAARANDTMLRQIQGFIYKNRERLIPGAINVVRTSPGIAALYASRVGQVAQREEIGRQIHNKLEIERASYRADDRRLYLPGTGLKGAIRTALLDDINQGRGLVSSRENNRDLQQRLLGYTMRELHQDPLRLLQMGDCHWQGDETLNSAEILFAVNRKKSAVTDAQGRLRESMAEGKGLYQLLECAAPLRLRAFRGQLAIPDPRGVDERKLPRHRFDFEYIARACQRFYGQLWHREQDLLRKRGYLDEEWMQQTGDLLDDPDLRRRIEEGSAFLLRVGRHSGAEAVTLNGLRSIKIMRGRGQRDAWEDSPRTLWLAARDTTEQRYLRPFGWLLVELADPGRHLPAWPAAEALQERAGKEMAGWLEDVRHRQRTLAEGLEQELAREEQRQRESAEEEARAERERQRLERLMPEERQMEDLVARLIADQAAGRKEAGGVLNAMRLQLLEDALQWDDPALRRKAASLIRQTAKHLPWAKKRKKEVQEKLTRLEGEA